MKQSLITLQELSNLTPFRGNVTGKFICLYVDIEHMMDKPFGDKFYDAIMADRSEYTLHAIEPDFKEGFTYVINDIVNYKGRFFKKIANDETATVTNPSCSTDWEVQPTFESDCLNGLHDRLKAWIAWKGAYRAAPFVQMEYGVGGFKKSASGNNKEALDENELKMIMGTYAKEAVIKFGILKKKMQSAYDDGDCDILENASFIKSKNLVCNTGP